MQSNVETISENRQRHITIICITRQVNQKFCIKFSAGRLKNFYNGRFFNQRNIVRLNLMVQKQFFINIHCQEWINADSYPELGILSSNYKKIWRLK